MRGISLEDMCALDLSHHTQLTLAGNFRVSVPDIFDDMLQYCREFEVEALVRGATRSAYAEENSGSVHPLAYMAAAFTELCLVHFTQV